jgi:hypothetical protein
MDREEAPPEEKGEQIMNRKTKAVPIEPEADPSRESGMVSDPILVILLKAQKYVEKRHGRFSARVIVWPAQIVNVHVSYEHLPNVGRGGFGTGTLRGDLGALRRNLEMMLDEHLGPGWREEE